MHVDLDPYTASDAAYYHRHIQTDTKMASQIGSRTRWREKDKINLLRRREIGMETRCLVCHTSVWDEANKLMCCSQCSRVCHQSCQQPGVASHDLDSVQRGFYCTFCVVDATLQQQQQQDAAQTTTNRQNATSNGANGDKRPTSESNCPSHYERAASLEQPRLHLRLRVKQLERINIELRNTMQRMFERQREQDTTASEKAQGIASSIDQRTEQSEATDVRQADMGNMVTLARHQVNEVLQRNRKLEHEIEQRNVALENLDIENKERQRKIAELEDQLAREQKKRQRIEGAFRSFESRIESARSVIPGDGLRAKTNALNKKHQSVLGYDS